MWALPQGVFRNDFPSGALLSVSGAFGAQPAPSPAGRIEGVSTDAGLTPAGTIGESMMETSKNGWIQDYEPCKLYQFIAYKKEKQNYKYTKSGVKMIICLGWYKK